MRGKDNHPSRPPKGPQVRAMARTRLRSLRVITSALAPDPSQIGRH